jgi:hypothetical protein
MRRRPVGRRIRFQANSERFTRSRRRADAHHHCVDEDIRLDGGSRSSQGRTRSRAVPARMHGVRRHGHRGIRPRAEREIIGPASGGTCRGASRSRMPGIRNRRCALFPKYSRRLGLSNHPPFGLAVRFPLECRAPAMPVPAPVRSQRSSRNAEALTDTTLSTFLYIHVP